MNGTEQRQRQTAVATVQRAIEDLTTILADQDLLIATVASGLKDLDLRQVRLAADMKHALDAHAAAVGQLRRDLIAGDLANATAMRLWLHLPFWQRLRWLARGADGV
jgi:hypothetical protein